MVRCRRLLSSSWRIDPDLLPGKHLHSVIAAAIAAVG
jgi:hypothetical protein